METLVSKERTYRICDSINVAEIQALQLDKKQFEKLVLDKDKQIQELHDKRKIIIIPIAGRFEPCTYD